MADIVELNQIEALVPHRPRWTHLLLRTPGAGFFQSLEWLEAYWRHFGAGRRLRVLLISQRGEICAIVPLVVRRCATRLGSLRMVLWPLDAWGTYYGPIGPDPRWALALAIDYLKSSPRDWDVIDLKHLGSVEAGASDSLETLPHDVAGCTFRTDDRTAVIDFAGGWDHYVQTRSAHWRRNFRAAERRLLLRGDVRFERFRPEAAVEWSPSDHPAAVATLASECGGACLLPALGGSGLPERCSSPAARESTDPRWDLFDACLQVAAASWQASAVRGTTLSSPSIGGFLRDVHEAAAALGALDVCLLWCGDRPIAFQYNYCWKGRLFGLRQGYDPDFARYSVGLVLMGMAVRDSFERGDCLLDLGVGSLDCKTPWAARLVNVGRLSCYPPGAVRAQLLRLGRWLRRRWNVVGQA